MHSQFISCLGKYSVKGIIFVQNTQPIFTRDKQLQINSVLCMLVSYKQLPKMHYIVCLFLGCSTDLYDNQLIA